MALNIYAGATKESMQRLPSPTELNSSREIIWSEDTGRAQSTEGGSTTKGKMIGDVVAEKITYAVKWGVLNNISGDKDYFGLIPSLLTAGFFWFGIGTTLNDAKANAKKFYRGEIQYDYLPVGNAIYYKDVSVQVIEQ